jgi:hypothetical protein
MNESEFLSKQIQRVFDRFVLPTIDKFVANVDCYDVEKLEPTTYRDAKVTYVKVNVKLSKKGYDERNVGLYDSISTLLFNGARNIITSDEYLIIEVSFYTMSSKLIYSTQLGLDDRISNKNINKFLNLGLSEEIARIKSIIKE